MKGGGLTPLRLLRPNFTELSHGELQEPLFAERSNETTAPYADVQRVVEEDVENKIRSVG